MRTNIDQDGRIEIPEALRDAAGLSAGSEVEIRLRDGVVVIESAAALMHLDPDGVIELPASEEVGALTAAAVRISLEQTRR